MVPVTPPGSILEPAGSYQILVSALVPVRGSDPRSGGTGKTRSSSRERHFHLQSRPFPKEEALHKEDKGVRTEYVQRMMVVWRPWT